MPIYSFRCNKCGRETEELLDMAERDRTLECTECKGIANRVFLKTPPVFLWEKDLNDQWVYDAEDAGVYD